MPFSSYFTSMTFIHVLIIVAVSIRIIKVRLPVSTSLAWLTLLFFLPLAGALGYMIFGERRLGPKFSTRSRTIQKRYERWLTELPEEILSDSKRLGSQGQSISRIAATTEHIPALYGNRLRLFEATEPILSSIINDIDQARKFCHLEFYIWNKGGMANEVLEALLRAAGRGVSCRVMLDAVGSAPFFKSRLVERLKAGNVEVAAALPISWASVLKVRPDLRLHRKIVIIDNAIGYTGSFNMVDPRFFRQDAGVGEWVDAMVRIEGPAVLALNTLFRWDWEMETGNDLDEEDFSGLSLETIGPSGSDVQVIPSGPGRSNNSIYQIILMAIYSAQSEIVITTPYFVPDEAVITALLTAAERGIMVTIILPDRNDSRLVHYTSRSYFDDMLSAGIRVFVFKGGLLHTKSVVIDRQVVLFGSVNLDIRSFWLDFEVTLGIYDSNFAQRLLKLHEKYIQDAVSVDLNTWRNRPRLEPYLENMARLASPLL